MFHLFFRYRNIISMYAWVQTHTIIYHIVHIEFLCFGTRHWSASIDSLKDHYDRWREATTLRGIDAVICYTLCIHQCRIENEVNEIFTSGSTFELVSSSTVCLYRVLIIRSATPRPQKDHQNLEGSREIGSLSWFGTDKHTIFVQAIK